MKCIDLVRTYLSADVPALAWGLPGTGKTASIASLARSMHVHLEVLVGSTTDPVDLGGYLIPNDGRVVVDPPPWAKRILHALDSGIETWLFLDELSCAPPAVQAAMLRIVNEREVAGLDLTGVRVIAASNDAATATAEGDIGPAMANRWAHVKWEIDHEAWISGTITRWGKPVDKNYALAAGAVTSYLSRDRAELLANPVAGQNAWASPRSWTAAIHSLQHLSQPMVSADARAVVAGCVGDAAALAWHTYQVNMDLPDAEEVLAGRAPLPKRGDRLSATLLTAVGAALVERADREQRVSAAWALLAGQRYDQVIPSARALLSGSDQVPAIALELGNKIRSLS